MEEKFTAVSLVHYGYTIGGIINRIPKKPTLVGFCVESPKKVLETAFQDYYVTHYNSWELFSSNDFEPTTPMLGLGIVPIKPVFGIEGKFEQLLQLDELVKVKRDNPISKQDTQRILNYLEHKLGIVCIDPTFMNKTFNKNKLYLQEIIDVVQKFG